ncbi:type II secretion system protein GspK [uncultured Pseudoteredinibacter sp.]|uniref:type II secretion system protein GspK n=1 Tax=uncultured Pseudoteredinibacter sp. TaxID=1641701 RepID=UPI00262ADBCD|nr:type II secretion system protein GspK [uncultured Pseudoteredinibacter sp.]
MSKVKSINPIANKPLNSGKGDRGRQSGAALLLVLLLLAVISILVVNSAENSYHLQRRLTMQKQQQAISTDLGAIEQYAFDYYAQSISSHNSSHPRQPWFENYSLAINESTVKAKLSPATPCINLNSIIDFDLQHLQTSPALLQLKFLLENIQAPNPNNDIALIHEYSSEILRSSSLDPIASKDSLAERLLAVGWKNEDWLRLNDFICFRPHNDSRWNTNNFSKEDIPLLRALLLNQLDRERSARLIDRISKKPLSSNHQFWNMGELQSIELPSQVKLQLQLRDEFYWLRITVARSHHKQAQWWFIQQQNQVLKKLFSYRM